MDKSRRRFINTLLGIGGIGTAGSIAYPILNYVIPPESGEPIVTSLKAGRLDEFEINNAKIIKFGRTPVILIREDKGNMIALAATCTHLDCIVQYRKDKKQIICACHNGIYDLKGRNISGPPPKPLEEFTVTIVNEEVIISSKNS